MSRHLDDEYTQVVHMARSQLDAVEASCRSVRVETDSLLRWVDEQRRLQRPTFPRSEHGRALDVAAAWAGAQPLVPVDLSRYPKPQVFDHLGESCGSPHVRLAPAGDDDTWRINVYALAPYTELGYTPLWSFTDGEVSVLCQAIRGRGFSISDTWAHEDGQGFYVTASSR